MMRTVAKTLAEIMEMPSREQQLDALRQAPQTVLYAFLLEQPTKYPTEFALRDQVWKILHSDTKKEAARP